MNRTILFHGKRTDNGEWVEGDLTCNKYILPWLNGEFYNRTAYYNGMEWCECCAYQIDPATVGQFTGLCDKNGTRIFEGDRCRVTRFAILAYGEITFENGCFWFKDNGPGGLLRLCDVKINGFEIEIIGNIHDNPELLEDKPCT